MAEEKENTVPFSPILIMEFVRQVTINKFLNSDTTDMVVRFKLAKNYYTQIKEFPLQAQTIHLEWQYDENAEVLSVRADDTIINRFKEQKSLFEIAGKYENQYAERYQQFISVIE